MRPMYNVWLQICLECVQLLVGRAVRIKRFWKIRMSSLKLIASTSLCWALLILNQNRTWFLAFNCLELKKKNKPVLIWGEERKDKNVPGNQFWSSIFLAISWKCDYIVLWKESQSVSRKHSCMTPKRKNKWLQPFLIDLFLVYSSYQSVFRLLSVKGQAQFAMKPKCTCFSVNDLLQPSFKGFWRLNT